MAYQWQTVEEAAVNMGISTRTLHRRIAKGEMETRLENGRREVFVCLPEPGAVTPDTPSAPADTPVTATSAPVTSVGQPLRSVSGDLSATVADTAIMLNEDHFRRMDLAIAAFQQSAAQAAAEVKRARSVGHYAWGAVGCLTAGIIIALTWAIHRDTWARADIQHLNGEVRRLTQDTAGRADEIERLRREVESAKVTAARAEGELAVHRVSDRPQPQPATRPTSVLTRLGNALTIKW